MLESELETNATETFRIDKYVFKKDNANRLGSGTFGAVYRGKNSEDDKPLAIKIINSPKVRCSNLNSKPVINRSRLEVDLK